MDASPPLSRFSLAGLCLAALVSGAAPALAADGLLMTSDYGNHRIRVQDLSSDKVVYDLDVQTSRVNPVCATDGAGCSPMGVHYSQYRGQDFLDVAVLYVDFHAGPGLLNLPSFIGRYELTSPARRVFLLEDLDFRDVPGHERYCSQGADEASGSRKEAGCRLSFAHGFKVVEDHPDQSWVSYVVADAFNGRVVQLTLDYSRGSRVAHVDWVMDSSDPEWPRGGLPNAAQVVNDPDGPFLLVTFYTNGEIPGASAGSLRMYKWVDGGWQEEWAFPESPADEAHLLHAVHMGQVITDPTSGRRWLFYAHGRSLASAYGTNPNTDLGGAAGVLKLGASLADPPTYLGEGVPYLDAALADPAHPPYRYARDVDFTEDGDLILTDASCENSCPDPGQHFLVRPFQLSLSPSPLSGAYSSSHEQQDLVDLEGEVLEQIQCGHGGAFESHYVPRRDIGRDLRRAADAATISCADESAPPDPGGARALPPLAGPRR